MADEVRLQLPAGTDYGRVARVTAAALARRHGFTHREVEDLRLAIDEAIIALLDHERPGAAMSLAFAVEGDRVAVTVVGAPDRPPAALDRFTSIVSGLVDVATIDLDDGVVSLAKAHHGAVSP